MKTIPVSEAEEQLSQLIAEAYQGELIVLTDGDRKVFLRPGTPFDLEEPTTESA